MKATVLEHYAFSWPLSAPQEIPRPAAVEAGAWRRFSRVARLAAAAAAPVLDPAELDRDELPMFFGTGLGEYSSSYGFLKSLFTRGPAMASPLLFQNSVHNAAAGHLSIALGLRGPSETLCAGALTTLRTFERALCWLEANSGFALVVLADDVNGESADGWRLGGMMGEPGEGGAAFLLAAADPRAEATLELLPRSEHAMAASSRRAAPFFCTADAQAVSNALFAGGEHRFDYPGCTLVASRL